MIKGHQTIFFHIIRIKSKAGATAAVVLLDETGKVVVTDNPSEAAGWFEKQHRQRFSQASAHLLSHSG